MADALRLLVDELEENPRVWGFPRIHVLKGDFSESGADMTRRRFWGAALGRRREHRDRIKSLAKCTHRNFTCRGAAWSKSRHHSNGSKGGITSIWRFTTIAGRKEEFLVREVVIEIVDGVPMSQAQLSTMALLKVETHTTRREVAPKRVVLLLRLLST